jgi:hypothetical protein
MASPCSAKTMNKYLECSLSLRCQTGSLKNHILLWRVIFLRVKSYSSFFSDPDRISSPIPVHSGFLFFHTC